VYIVIVVCHYLIYHQAAINAFSLISLVYCHFDRYMMMMMMVM